MTQAVTPNTAINPRPADGPYTARRIAFVQAGWHAEIVDRARQGFVEEIAALGFSRDLVDRFEAPGAFEIPLMAQTLARGGRYGAIVAAGLVVDGGVYRHDFVAQAVINGVMQVQLGTGVPIFSVVLTPHHYRDGAPLEAMFREHFVQKGQEAAQACAQVLAGLAA